MLTQAGPRTDIVMLAGENVTSWIVYNYLVARFGPFPVIVEEPVARGAMIRSRIRRLGLVTTLSQVAFVTLIRPMLRRAARRRIRAICQEQGLETAAPAAHYIRKIASVNGAQCRDALAAIKPKAVVVNGTRIIKRDILQAPGGIFINLHQGITPQYRGAHGGYWALHENDRGHCGVTVHIVDEGIDTGGVVAQALINPGPDDNFATYPFLQTAAALPGLVSAVEDVLAGRLAARAVEGPSAVWYHPGFVQYLRGRLRGIR